MKPDWQNAPEWAQWLAQDADGGWFWYEQKPILRDEIFNWVNRENGQHSFAAAYSLFDWKETLERRPTTVNPPKIGEYWPEHGGLYFGRIEEDGRLYALIVSRNYEGERTQANWHEAKQFCRCLMIGGFEDWQLPTRYDLLIMFKNNSKNIGLFSSSNWYWSATEFGADNAWVQGFTHGYQANNGKTGTNSVRAVRKVLI